VAEGVGPDTGLGVTRWLTKEAAHEAFIAKMGDPNATLPNGWVAKLDQFIQDFIVAGEADSITLKSLRDMATTHWPTLMVYVANDGPMKLMTYNQSLIKKDPDNREQWVLPCPLTRRPLSINEVMSFQQLVEHDDRVRSATTHHGIVPAAPAPSQHPTILSRLKKLFSW